MNSEFQELLITAGHRPAKFGRRWICRNCQPDKTPALSVDRTREVFYCHRCGVGGGLASLKKEFHIGARKPRRRRDPRVEWLVERVKAREAEVRASLNAKFRLAIDTEITLRAFGKASLERGESISDTTLQQLCLAALEGERLKEL